MAMVNVNRKVTDQFYRYKMPKLIAKVEGKGNGIKTVIVNMVDIAKSLSRPPAYPTKFFGCELGAQTQIDKKNDRYIVNGAHDADKLQEILDIFIEKFVLCVECDNPETELSVLVKKEKINQRCIACGHACQITMNHRLITFILKNPPTDDSATPMKAKKVRGKSSDDTSPANETNSNPYNEGNVSLELNRMESNSSFDDDWSEDTSKEAVQRRMELLSEGVKGLTYHVDLEKSQEARVNIFFEFVKAKRTEENNLSCNEKDVLSEAERLDVKDKGILVLAEIFLSSSILADMKKFRKLFLQFVAGNQKAQRYLLGALEMVIQSYPDQLLPKVAHVLKLAYDLDLVEEEVILQWGSKVSKKYVAKDVAEKIHAKAKPFLEWLQNAEEESSEEDEEVEVVYTKTAAAKIVQEAPAAAPTAVEDDIDIDAI